MITKAQLRGYLLEEALAWLLRNTGYRLLVDESQDPDELIRNWNGLCVKGRGADHQVDVLGEFAFTPAFSLPIRLFLEAKFTGQKIGLAAVRNAHGVIHDINENFVPGPGQRLRKRYRYVYSLFSATGFTQDAQDYALAQQISLVNLSGASFAWLRDAVSAAASELYVRQERYGMRSFPVTWMRWELRRRLGTMPAVQADEDRYPQTSAYQFAESSGPIFRRLTNDLSGRQRYELLLGFPSAPFILPLATADAEQFLAYATANPEHQVRLRRTGRGKAAEWTVIPAGQPRSDLLFTDQSERYSLTFNLPDELEFWIAQDEEYRVRRIRAVKTQFLSDIVIYRMEGDKLRTFQLQYHPNELRR